MRQGTLSALFPRPVKLRRLGLRAWREPTVCLLPLALCLGLILLLAFVVFHYFFLTFTVALSLALLLAPPSGKAFIYFAF